MRKVILDLAVTLDGFIEGPNGETDWCILDDDMNFGSFLAEIDTILYGRVSYEMWGNYSPAADASETEQSLWAAVHTKNKIVFSSQHRQDNAAIYISENIPAYITTLKQQPGKDIWLYGGAKLISTFIQHSLIDVYRLSVHPIALGTGKPLFENLKDRVNLKLTTVNTFRSGVVQLIYEKCK